MDLALPCLAGLAVAMGVTLLGRVAGLDRDRAFYPTALIVIASYYDLFAVMGGSTRALIVETVLFSAFLAAAVVGFRKNLWIVVAGLAGHGVMDFFHGHLVSNPGVPAWWPWWCLSYDVAAAACLAWLLSRSKIQQRPAA